jgi:hypothetical protein
VVNAERRPRFGTNGTPQGVTRVPTLAHMDKPIQGDAFLRTHECWAWLRTAEVGRLAVMAAGRIELFPVNFAVDAGTVVFRTADGAKLEAIRTTPDVVFEADGRSADGHAWSVVLRGRARQVTRVDDLIASARLPLTPWHEADKNRFIRITPSDISGRRFPIVDPGRWRSNPPSS